MTPPSVDFPTTAERRALTRCHWEAPVVLVLKNGIWTARLHDISTRGLGVLVTQELSAQSRLMVELFNPRANFWHRKALEVVHATPHGSDGWLLGSLFLQEFTADELHALLS